MWAPEVKRKLWARNEIITDEAFIPLVPRDFWLFARKAYESDGLQEVSSILLAGLAVESGVNEYVSAWLYRKLGKDQIAAMKFLEDVSIDFRKLVELMWFIGAFSDSLKSDLHDVYNSRNKYAHMQVMKIVGNKGEVEFELRSDGQVVKKLKAKEDEFMRSLLVMMNAAGDAYQILRKTELCLKGLFDKDESDYWRQLVWGGLEVSPKSADSH
jgi:hypothetical protein